MFFRCNDLHYYLTYSHLQYWFRSGSHSLTISQIWSVISLKPSLATEVHTVGPSDGQISPISPLYWTEQQGKNDNALREGLLSVQGRWLCPLWNFLEGAIWHLQRWISCSRSWQRYFEDWTYLYFVPCMGRSTDLLMSLKMGEPIGNPKVIFIVVYAHILVVCEVFWCSHPWTRNNRDHCAMQDAFWLAERGTSTMTSSVADWLLLGTLYLVFAAA